MVMQSKATTYSYTVSMEFAFITIDFKMSMVMQRPKNRVMAFESLRPLPLLARGLNILPGVRFAFDLLPTVCHSQVVS